MIRRFRIGDEVLFQLSRSIGFQEGIIVKKSKYKRHGNSYFGVEIKNGMIHHVGADKMKIKVRASYKEKLKEIINEI